MKKISYFCKYNWRSLVEANVKQLDAMIKFYSKWEEGDICDDLIHCSELGHKLLENNYYEKSDAGAGDVDKLLADGKFNEAFKLDLQYEKVYKKDYKIFSKDLNKFFKMIAEYAKEWY